MWKNSPISFPWSLLTSLQPRFMLAKHLTWDPKNSSLNTFAWAASKLHMGLLKTQIPPCSALSWRMSWTLLNCHNEWIYLISNALSYVAVSQHTKSISHIDRANHKGILDHLYWYIRSPLLVYPSVKLGLDLIWLRNFWSQLKVEEKWGFACLQKTPWMHPQEYIMKTTQKFDNRPKHSSTNIHHDVISIFCHYLSTI